jgi:alpha-L-rhamnosidase
MTTFNHFALGSVADWMHRVIGGLSPAAPGYQRIEWAPEPGGGLDHARVAFESPYGLIEGSWRRSAEGVHYDLSVPTGVEGTIRIAGLDEQRIESGGRFEVFVSSSEAVAA